MARVFHGLGLGVTAIALLGVLSLAVMAADPPVPNPDTSGAVPPPQVSDAPAPTQTPTTSPTMPKAIATADQPAIVSVTPPRTALSAGTNSALQITVRAEAVEEGKSYLVNVYAVPAPEKAEASPKPDQNQMPKAEQKQTLVGSFAFFPPPREGEVRTFTLPTPESAAVAGPDITLKVELVPATPDTKLDKSTLAIVDAKIATE